MVGGVNDRIYKRGAKKREQPTRKHVLGSTPYSINHRTPHKSVEKSTNHARQVQKMRGNMVKPYFFLTFALRKQVPLSLLTLSAP